MSVITEILDRLSGVEVVKEKLRDTGVRIERLAQSVVELDGQLRGVDRRLVRIDALSRLPRRSAGARGDWQRANSGLAGRSNDCGASVRHGDDHRVRIKAPDKCRLSAPQEAWAPLVEEGTRPKLDFIL